MNNKNNKNLPILLALGMFCLLWGLGSFYVEQGFGISAIALSLLGIISLLTCFIVKGKSVQRRLKLPQWKKVSVICLVVLLSLVIFVGINYLAFFLPFRWDVTRAKQHTLTARTLELVKGSKAQVQLTAFYVGLPPKYLEDLFKEYERISDGKIKAEIIDPIQQIGYAAKFGNFIDSKENKVVVLSGDERRDIDFTEAFLTEEQLTNAIMRVTREERHVYFLTGHGEYDISHEGDQGLSILTKLLLSNNVLSKSLMLGIEEKIPEDCDVLVIAGPHNDLTEKEETIIEEYLRSGGDALFLIEHVVVTTPDKPLTDEEKRRNPSLNSILNQWGVNVGEDVVVDLSSHAGSDVGSPATRNYMPHKAITQGLDYTFYVRPRSITALEKRRSAIKLAPIVLTAKKGNSWAESDRTLKIHFDETVDKPGPVTVSVVILEKKEEGDLSDTRIIVFTDADFLTNIFINQYSNAKMGLNIIKWLSESDYNVFLDQREIEVQRLDLTSKQKRKVAVVLILMPVFIFACGIIVWMKS